MNDFLLVHLAPKVTEREFKTIDRRWPTTRKYVEGVRLGYSELFREDDEVMPQLTELFDVRNRLVHGTPGSGPDLAYLPDPHWRDLYAPEKVAEWLIAVAGAAHSMDIRCYGFDYYSMPAMPIWIGRGIVRQRASLASLLPDSDTTEQTPLIRSLLDHVRGVSTNLPDGLVVAELREARLALARTAGPWDPFTKMITGSASEGKAT